MCYTRYLRKTQSMCLCKGKVTRVPDSGKSCPMQMALRKEVCGMWKRTWGIQVNSSPKQKPFPDPTYYRGLSLVSQRKEKKQKQKQKTGHLHQYLLSVVTLTLSFLQPTPTQVHSQNSKLKPNLTSHTWEQPLTRGIYLVE